MNCRSGVVLLAFAAVVCAQEPADTSQLLLEARNIAISYSKSLPDFICTELIHRYQAMGPTGNFRPTDTLTLQLSYFQLKENYKLVTRNNKPTKQSLESVGGAFTQGEFGSKLLLIFHPVSKAEFQFEEWSTINDHRVAVFKYAVKRVNSRFEMRVGATSTIAGYHGEVFIDQASRRVLRIAESVDIPDGLPVQFSHDTSDYDFVDVNGQQYLLPVHCETLSADLPPTRGRNGRLMDDSLRMAGQLRYRNEIDFRDYRKYAAESSISFDPPKQ